MACGASGCVNGPRRGLDKPLSLPPPRPRALLKLPAGPSQGAAGWGPAGTKPLQFSSQFSPLPRNVLAAVGPPFSSLSTRLMFRATGETQTLQNIPECKAFAMSHSCGGASKGCSRPLEGAGRGQPKQLQGLCQRLDPGQRSGGTGWNEERQQWEKGCVGAAPLTLPHLLSSSLSPEHFHRKNNLLEYRGLQVGFWKMIPGSLLTNNQEGLSSLGFATHYFKMHCKNAVGTLFFTPTQGAFTGSHCRKILLPCKSQTEHLGVKTLPF